MNRTLRAGLPVLLIAILALIAAGRAADRAIIIVGADLADGTGAPLRRANVRFVDDRIASVGDVKPQAGDTVDRRQRPGRGAGLHRHPQSLVVRAGRRSCSRDAGRAGHHHGRRRTRRRFAVADRRLPVGAAAAHPPPSTCASFVGHATVRRQVMKDDFKRPARTDEIARMALLVDQGMREGAAGLSSGLEYEVGGYAETAELIELAKVVARYGGVYMSHIRDEADKSFDALEEAIAIGERAHVAVQISHIKLGTVGVWRKAADAVALVEAARSAASTSPPTPIPTMRGSRRSPCSCRTSGTTTRRASSGRSPTSAARRTCWSCGMRRIRSTSSSTLDAIAAEQKRTPVGQFIQIVKDGGATVVCTSMIDEDIRAFYRAAVGDGRERRRPREPSSARRRDVSAGARALRPRPALADAAGGDSQDDQRPGGAAAARRARADQGRRDRRRRALQRRGRSSIARRSLIPACCRPASKRCSSAASSCGTRRSRPARARQGVDVRPHAGRQRCRRV